MGYKTQVTAPAPEAVYVRFKITMVEVDDVQQLLKPSVDVFAYYEPTYEVEGVHKDSHMRFHNIAKPRWVPHIDFGNEVAEPLTTDESYWLDSEEDLIFMRWTVIPTVQDRFDHAAFPFDRQVLDVQLMSNNSQLKGWELTDPASFPVECSMHRQDWLVQCELAAVADMWDLKDVQLQVVNDSQAWSSSAHFQIFLQRSSDYFLWNIGFVYALIIGAQACLIAFPYNEARFDFAMALALTSVAFLFVSSAMVPKTSYLTRLDQYFLLGLVLLALRFLADTIMQFAFEVPVGEEGYRGECDFTDDEIGICRVDEFVTIALSGAWLFSSLVFLAFGKIVFRPSWDAVNRRVENPSKRSRIEFEIKGRADSPFETRVMSYQDIQNSVDINVSNSSFKNK
ncbi:Hypothetical Protein FCC1311_027672 [Hondaea fermentalgiana]|uniref:Uncharacterized protein n=1 Tax=Hondaea fermentalgiana TaxID=2315210 RepID=A0A2R5G681_9STRA|nr:Hypothetical Protein FCC1311_027672 [Hondaea fermentalgiana]|eukprot:GBG26546.1 Hypothetical Protein FCC1311_027672 [Hondaea fermentalgiana]